MSGSWLSNPAALRHLALATEVRQLLVVRDKVKFEQTADLAQLVIGDRDEGSIAAFFLPERIEVRFLVVHWPLPHTPYVGTRLWKSVDVFDVDASDVLALLAEAPKAWKRHLRRCTYCRELLPSERLMTINRRRVCHGCATEHEGVVF